LEDGSVTITVDSDGFHRFGGRLYTIGGVDGMEFWSAFVPASWPDEVRV
jgi:hypothetical protein